MSRCLIITRLADRFAAEVARLSGGTIPVTACNTAAEARAAYTDETVLFGNPQMIAEVLDGMPTVDWVQSSWAGVTPLVDAPRRDYVLTGVKGVFGPQMAEYTLGFLLAHELKVHARRAAQNRHEWFGRHSGTLFGKTLGVLGTGSIGSAIARAAGAFGLDLRGCSRSGRANPAFGTVHPVRELRAFLDGLDYLVSTLPATPATNHLLDATALRCLPAHAVFVNVGRSNVIDDVALVEALSGGRLGAAILDVFDEEPLPEASPLWDVPNLTVTAHVAAISHPLMIVPLFVHNFALYSAGEPLEYVVDFSTGY